MKFTYKVILAQQKKLKPTNRMTTMTMMTMMPVTSIMSTGDMTTFGKSCVIVMENLNQEKN